jgi:hypothetical protein
MQAGCGLIVALLGTCLGLCSTWRWCLGVEGRESDAAATAVSRSLGKHVATCDVLRGLLHDASPRACIANRPDAQGCLRILAYRHRIHEAFMLAGDFAVCVLPCKPQ